MSSYLRQVSEKYRKGELNREQACRWVRLWFFFS